MTSGEIIRSLTDEQAASNKKEGTMSVPSFLLLATHQDGWIFIPTQPCRFPTKSSRAIIQQNARGSMSTPLQKLAIQQIQPRRQTKFSPLQRQILTVFMEHPNTIVSMEMIMTAIWGEATPAMAMRTASSS